MDKFGTFPNTKDLKIVAYDAACGLHPFLLNRLDSPMLKAWSELDYVIDKFHSSGVNVKVFNI